MTYLAAVAAGSPLTRASRGKAPSPERFGPQAVTAAEIDIRQLRHHTKNTLQRLLAVIADTPGLCETPAGERLARELEHRISLSAAISNALFGLTESPGSMQERLRQLAGANVDLMRSPDQIIRVGVSVRGSCPMALREAALRGANELIGNAVKHGMKDRPTGRIVVRLVSDTTRTILTVTDDGWGFTGKPQDGEGLTLARNFAERHGGTLVLDGTDGTQATLMLPHPVA
ncbi:MAG TPA: ATP-binding protein [Rhodopila sp.]|nr:ATP-binding protein [Rhodopila sp.]